MHKQNSLLLIIAFILLPLFTLAQQPKIIVVTVADTINVPGDKFSNVIQHFDSSAIELFDLESKTTATSVFLSLTELIELAKNANGNVKNNTPINLDPNMKINILSVDFLRLSDRDSFETALENVANVKVRTISASSNAIVVDNRIIGKILNTAQRRAATIAKELGYKLGDVLEVEEIKTDINGGGWIAYPPLSIPPTSDVPTSPDKAVQSANFKFKFAAFRE